MPTIIFLLKALIPYSRESFMLGFKPAKFFAELEKTTGRGQEAFRLSYKRAKKSGLITSDPVPRLTAKGQLKLAPFTAERLGKEAKLMIIFDIPEQSSILRSQLRRLLRNLKFEQVQKSVWVTKYDHREIMREAIKELGLSQYVQLYECANIDTQ